MSFGVFSCCQPPVIPLITANPTSMTFQQFFGTPTAVQTSTVTGSNLTTDITVTAPTGYQVSLNGTTWSSSVIIPQTGGSASATLYIRLNASITGIYNQNIVLSSTGASNVDIVCTGKCLQPTITLSVPTMTFLKHNPLASPSQNYTVSGNDLVAPVTVTVGGAAYEISTDNINFFPSLTLPHVSGILAATIIYVRFIETNPGSANLNIVHSSTNATNATLIVNGNYTIRNRYTFATGTVPSIASFQNNYVPGIANPQIIGDDIYFDNASWTPVVSNKWTGNTDILQVISSKNEIKQCYKGCTSIIGFIGVIPIADNTGGMFNGATSLASVDATFPSIIDFCFKDTAIADFGFMANTNSINGANNFENCLNATDFDFSGLTTSDFATSNGDENSFLGITGQTIAITAKIAHQTNNAGGMDGDLATLNAANTCTFNWVP